jgi:hypothetical protein
MLNWVEVAYPHSGEIPGRGQVPLVRADWSDGASAPGVVEAHSNAPLVLFTAAGERVLPFITPAAPCSATFTVRFEVAALDEFFISGGERLQASRIERDRPSGWRGANHQADYLMVVHAGLIEAIEPLARFHRKRGLEVAVVDIEEIYDEFSHGIIDPTAIRDFISHAYHNWQPPAPRFVLLAGDASWDTKNTEVDDRNYADWVASQLGVGHTFPGRNVPAYAGRPAINDRQLIPTWNYTSHEGHSASDNWFVAVDGDDHFPDLAIGRLPVVEPAEVEAIVAKTIAYARTRSPDRGTATRSGSPTRARCSRQQRWSSRAARSTRLLGVQGLPEPEEASNERHQAALQERFNEGQLIVHFLGHGGRHIWRTGPPDFHKNHDLFTLDHVAQLAPTRRLAFVLSMTCYSAPFDHPNQDSIGETFLRVPDRGAIGVFAASWRNSPSRSFSQLILDGLTTPGTPVGVAIMNAKDLTESHARQTYNLLGDPAIPLAVPHGRYSSTSRREGAGSG